MLRAQQEVGRQLRRLSDEFFFDYTSRRRVSGGLLRLLIKLSGFVGVCLLRRGRIWFVGDLAVFKAVWCTVLQIEHNMSITEPSYTERASLQNCQREEILEIQFVQLSNDIRVSAPTSIARHSRVLRFHYLLVKHTVSQSPHPTLCTSPFTRPRDLSFDRHLLKLQVNLILNNWCESLKHVYYD